MLISASYFAQLSKIIVDNDRQLLKFYGVSDHSKWNDAKSMEKRAIVIESLRTLACQQQDVLRYKGITPAEVTFDSIKRFDILEDFDLIVMYVNSRLLYNNREILSRISSNDLLPLNDALEYIVALRKVSKVFAVTKPEHIAEVHCLSAMYTKSFWGKSAAISAENVTYFSALLTGANIPLAQALRTTGNVVIAL